MALPKNLHTDPRSIRSEGILQGDLCPASIIARNVSKSPGYGGAECSGCEPATRRVNLSVAAISQVIPPIGHVPRHFWSLRRLLPANRCFRNQSVARSPTYKMASVSGVFPKTRRHLKDRCESNPGRADHILFLNTPPVRRAVDTSIRDNAERSDAMDSQSSPAMWIILWS